MQAQTEMSKIDSDNSQMRMSLRRALVPEPRRYSRFGMSLILCDTFTLLQVSTHKTPRVDKSFWLLGNTRHLHGEAKRGHWCNKNERVRENISQSRIVNRDSSFHLTSGAHRKNKGQ